MALLNVAVTRWPVHTFTARLAGRVEETSGGVLGSELLLPRPLEALLLFCPLLARPLVEPLLL